MKDEKKISLATLTGLAVLFGVIITIGVGLTFYCAYTGMFQSNLETVLQKGQQNLQSGYSKEIYNRMRNQTLADYLKDSNLKYTVIKGQKLDDETLSDKENYVYTNTENLDKKVLGNVLEKYTCREKFTTEYTYQFHQSLLHSIGDAGMASRWSLPDSKGIYGDHLNKTLYYNQENKILYFVGEIQMYPVKRIQVANKYAWSEESRRRYGMDGDAVSSYKLTYNAQGEGRYQMWGEPRLNLNLDNYRDWKTFTVESGFQYTNSTNNAIRAGKENPKPVFENPLNDADGGYWIEFYDVIYDDGMPELTAWYRSDVDLSVETWWVLSYVEEELDAGADDMFLSQKKLITILYRLRYVLLGVTILAGICLVLCAVQGWQRERNVQRLMPESISSGDSSDRREIQKQPFSSQVSREKLLHRLPALLYLGRTAGIIAAIAYVGSIGWDMLWRGGYTGYSPAYQLPGGFLMVCCIALIVFVLWGVFNEVAYRAGVGSLWKNTVIYMFGKCLGRGIDKLGRGIRRVKDTLRENLSLVTKTVMIMFGLIALEFLCMLLYYGFFRNMAGSLVVLLIMKIPEIFLVLSMALQMKKLQNRAQQMAEGDLEGRLDNETMFWEFKKHGDYLNQISNGMSIALEERLKSEHFRTELIANVSHDVNTPLTSIINYVDLLKKENMEEPRVQEYLEVLDRQSARLKKLIQDLMEASKASTGNLTVIQEICDVDILLTQALGEFEEKMEAAQLRLIISKPEKEMLIWADNRHLWRIFDNLMSNICKYSQPGTRVYINLEEREEQICIIFRNISQYQLNISSEELLERFVRGDSSRNTEGSGLGLSIVQKLAELMGGEIRLSIDGDLFKAMVFFPKMSEEDLQND